MSSSEEKPTPPAHHELTFQQPMPHFESQLSQTQTSSDVDGEKHNVVLSPTLPYPRFNNAEKGYNPRTITLQENRTMDRRLSLQRTQTLQRTQSISMSTGPRRADRGARMVGEFRTLSLHVTETKRAKDEEKEEKLKKDAEKELASIDFHTLSIEDLCHRFTVSNKIGLDADQAQRRLAANGPNRISPPPKNLFKKWFGYIFGGFGSLLFFGGILSIISWKPLGNPTPVAADLALGVVLLIVMVLQTAFNAWQDYSTGAVMDSIASMLPSDVNVLRDGHKKTVPAADLVNGDIVYVTLGNKIPADLRFIEVSSDLKVDRAVLTGESEPISGTVDSTDENFLETQNVALQGTLCVGGSAIGLVVQTGDNTVFGRIAKLSTGEAKGSSTMQKELTRFIMIICSMAFALSLFFIIIWAAWLNPKHHGYITVANLIIDVVSVSVAFIPEGLPACVTISLAVVASALAKKQILCKSLITTETLGATNVICSDKTGTLTQNKMTVTRACILDDEFSTMEARESFVVTQPRSSNVRQLAAIAGICNGATFDPTENEMPAEIRTVIGDATDSAILRFSELLSPIARAHEPWEEVFKASFSSKTKFMLKILRLSDGVPSSARPAPLSEHDESFGGQDLMLMCKGAPDVLLARCTKSLDPSGGPPIDLSPQVIARLTRTQESWAAKGMRVLLLARRAIPRSEVPKDIAFDTQQFADHVNMHLNQGLTVVGLVGLVDPPKVDTEETVTTLRGAYIRFMMVTGDFPLTAVAIAEQCGIVTNASTIHHLDDLDRDLNEEDVVRYDAHANRRISSLVLTGTDLMKMNETQWLQAIQYDEVVFARTTPEQKLRIVKEYQASGNIVAMTGDGVNDAPSLKIADIGIAMGGGSDVACEAADLILLDSFSAMVTAVERGRLVFDNLKKTCLYLMPAGSFSELMPLMLNLLLGLPQALSSLQMIIICAVTDILPALSLAYEQSEAGLLDRPPRDVRTDRLVDWKLLFHAYFVLGMMECVSAMALSFSYLQRKGVYFSDIVLSYGGYKGGLSPEIVQEHVFVAQSIYFFTLVIMQWGNLLSTRTRRVSIFQHPPIFNKEGKGNPFIIPAMLVSLTLCIFFSYVPFFQKAFNTRGVPVEYIFIPIALAIGVLFVDEVRKYFVRRYPNGLLARIAW